MKTWIAAAFFALAGPATALEPPPLTPEQIACSPNEDAVAVHVIDARSYACDIHAPNCYPTYVGVTAVVDEVIEPSSADVRVGDRIRASIMVYHPLHPEYAQEHNGAILFPEVNMITDDFARSQLVGKRLFLSTSPVRRSLQGGIPPRVSEPNYAEAYPSEDEGWFRRTWASPGCQEDRAKAEVWRRRRGLDGGP